MNSCDGWGSTTSLSYPLRRFVEAFVYYCSCSIQLVQIVSSCSHEAHAGHQPRGPQYRRAGGAGARERRQARHLARLRHPRAGVGLAPRLPPHRGHARAGQQRRRPPRQPPQGLCLNDVRKYNSFVTNVQNEDDKIIVIEQLRELAGIITGSLSHIHAQICFTCALHVAPKNI